MTTPLWISIQQLLWYNEDDATDRDRSTVIAISLLRICDLSTWHSAAVPAHKQISTGQCYMTCFLSPVANWKDSYSQDVPVLSVCCLFLLSLPKRLCFCLSVFECVCWLVRLLANLYNYGRIFTKLLQGIGVERRNNWFWFLEAIWSLL